MQPTFDTAFYQRTHMDLEDELLKLALSVQFFNEQTQDLSAIWSDDAGRRIRQIHMLPMLEQAKQFEGTSTLYLETSDERLRHFNEMKKLIGEYAGLHSRLEDKREECLEDKEEYQRVTSISERQRDKSLEFASKSNSSRRRADSHIAPL